MSDLIFDTPEDALMHFGTLGMKWGFRKARSLSTTNHSVALQNKLISKAKESHSVGGKNHSVSLGKKAIAKGKEAHARTLAKRAPEHNDLRKTKKDPAKNLSNAELQKAIARMNLEKQYNTLNPHGLSKGQKQVATILALGATVNAAIVFAQSPAGKFVIESLKKAATKVA